MTVELSPKHTGRAALRLPASCAAKRQKHKGVSMADCGADTQQIAVVERNGETISSIPLASLVNGRGPGNDLPHGILALFGIECDTSWTYEPVGFQISCRWASVNGASSPVSK